MEELKINETLGITAASVLNREYNLWIGISLDNKWFTPENIRRLIIFGLAHTRGSVMIWVPGRIQSINLRYFDGLRRAEALREAFALEGEKRQVVDQILASLDESLRAKVVVANYDEICTSHFIKQREVLFREFSEQKEFYRRVMEIAEDGLQARGRTVSRDRAESVALYVLEELPLFLDGLEKIGRTMVYSVILYPGLGKLDKLIVDIINAEVFAVLRQKLDIQTRTGIVSVG